VTIPTGWYGVKNTRGSKKSPARSGASN
jgi:hypothetical protein